jgi:hypothetical protein
MHERLLRLRNAYQGWHIWQSSVGRWWAADQDVTWPQILSGCVATVDADDLDGLEELLGQQETRRMSVGVCHSTSE